MREMTDEQRAVMEHQRMRHPYFLTGRGEGKTYALIEWVLRDPTKRRIICADERRAEFTERRMRELLELRGLDSLVEKWVPGDRPYHMRRKHLAVTVADMVSGRYRGVESQPNLQYAVDDLEAVLRQTLHVDVWRVAGTGFAVSTQAEWYENELNK